MRLKFNYQQHLRSAAASWHPSRSSSVGYDVNTLLSVQGEEQSVVNSASLAKSLTIQTENYFKLIHFIGSVG